MGKQIPGPSFCGGVWVCEGSGGRGVFLQVHQSPGAKDASLPWYEEGPSSFMLQESVACEYMDRQGTVSSSTITTSQSLQLGESVCQVDVCP